jgi:hypothetical protein
MLLLIVFATKINGQCNEPGGVKPEFKGSPDYRHLVAGIVGSVPGLIGAGPLGSALHGLTLFLWPDNSSEEVFQAMVDYVNKLVPELISQERIHTLQEHVQGLKEIVADYDDTTDPLQKGEYLTSFIATLDSLEPQFFDDRAPEKTLAPLVAFGTLKLVALREQYLNAHLYYGNDDRDRAMHYQKLKNTVEKYTKATAGIRKRLLDARMAKIHFKVLDKTFTRLPFNRRDPELNGTVEEQGAVYDDDFCGTHKSVELYYRDRGSETKNWGEWNALIKEGPAQARKAYEESLDLILTPTKDWPQLIPPVNAEAPAATQGPRS